MSAERRNSFSTRGLLPPDAVNAAVLMSFQCRLCDTEFDSEGAEGGAAVAVRCPKCLAAGRSHVGASLLAMAFRYTDKQSGEVRVVPCPLAPPPPVAAPKQGGV